MEPYASYIIRFMANRDMRELFYSVRERAATADRVFQVRWKAALVTVTKADGEKFYID